MLKGFYFHDLSIPIPSSFNSSRRNSLNIILLKSDKQNQHGNCRNRQRCHNGANALINPVFGSGLYRTVQRIATTTMDVTIGLNMQRGKQKPRMVLLNLQLQSQYSDTGLQWKGHGQGMHIPF